MSGGRRKAIESRTTYLGFPILVRQHTLTIYSQDGQRVLAHGRMTMSGARRFIKGYRKAA